MQSISLRVNHVAIIAHNTFCRSERERSIVDRLLNIVFSLFFVNATAAIILILSRCDGHILNKRIEISTAIAFSVYIKCDPNKLLGVFLCECQRRRNVDTATRQKRNKFAYLYWWEKEKTHLLIYLKPVADTLAFVHCRSAFSLPPTRTHQWRISISEIVIFVRH